MNGFEARAPGFGSRELEEGLPDAFPAMGGIDGNIVERNPSSSTDRTITPTTLPWLSARVTRRFSMTST